ncbi:hypothetical protein FCH28_26440 [Streptomyces piniterrae]|uniref:Hydrogenase expression protein HypF n=1 Tax=Streptomyces piniterrae TaxID=2571125 RepID=A0A4V6WHG0_9ACTN|nr:hypothetical protein [Streptomyces piniterrae]TJZ46068.1 hypothetical protein FCH28_26440 [Streptomyces piniterrae]
MPGDELHQNAAAGARSGPRHAAPKKPLLTRLHVPAGKAIAIAAMPSAVLMGMGLTPQMAMAKPQPPTSPFKDGPCVTAPDKTDKDGEDSTAKDGAKDDAGPSATTSPKPSPSASSEPTKAPEPSAPKTDEPSGSATPSPSPSASEEKDDGGGLLGGIGDAIGGLLGGDDSKEAEASPSPSPSESTTTASPSPSPSPSKDSTSTDSGDSGSDKVTDTVKGVTDGVTRGVEDPSKAANDTVHGAVGAADSSLPGGGLDGKDSDGKKSYPCVVENKQEGKNEQTPVTLPDDPWHLESSGLTLRGLDFEGVVNVTTQSGRTKQALKFTADTVDIADLHQTVDDRASGKHYHVRSDPGSTSTMRGGKVTMYTERLQGNLFGLIPIVFDPEHPPPINVSFAYFTKVKIDQAGQFGGNLHVPGMRVSIED